MAELGRYNPNVLSLVPREAMIRTVMVEDEKYEVETLSKPNNKISLTRKSASNVVALAIAGALTIGASSAIITLVNSSSSQEYNECNYIMYVVPSEITEAKDIKVKVFPDGRATIILKDGEEEYYNGKSAEKLLYEASSKGMLYRDTSDYRNTIKKR